MSQTVTKQKKIKVQKPAVTRKLKNGDYTKLARTNDVLKHTAKRQKEFAFEELKVALACIQDAIEDLVNQGYDIMLDDFLKLNLIKIGGKKLYNPRKDDWFVTQDSVTLKATPSVQFRLRVKNHFKGRTIEEIQEEIQKKVEQNHE